MKVWSDLVYDDAIAKSKGTFDAVNSNQSGVLIAKKDATSILGFLIGYASSVVTDAQAIPDLFVEVTNKALGIVQAIVPVALGSNDSDANTPSTPMRTKFVPFKAKAGTQSKIFNSTFTFKAAPSVTNTGGLSIVIAVLYANTEPDNNYAMELLAMQHGRVTDGDAQADAAKAHASAGGAVTLTSLTIPSGTSQLRAILASINPNGITASKVKSGFMEYIAPGITDFSPQLWPLTTFWNAALGTVADEPGVSGDGRLWPTRFPLPGSEVTVQVQSTLVVAATTAPNTSQAILFE